MNNQKGVALAISPISLLTILLIAGVVYLVKIQCPKDTIPTGNGCQGAGAILTQPVAQTVKDTQKDTKNWKVYDGGDYNLQYPPSWELTKVDTGSGGLHNGMRENIWIFDPSDYTLGGPHKRGDSKNYRHAVQLWGLKTTNQSSSEVYKQSEQQIEDGIDGMHTTKDMPRFHTSFDKNNSHFEIYGWIENDNVDPTSLYGTSTFNISNGKKLLSGFSTMHNSSTNSTEYVIISSIVLK